MALKLLQSPLLVDERKPREKIRFIGVESLNDSELISTILGTGYKSLSVDQLSKYLLAEFGTRGLFQFNSLDDFQSATGLPLVKSCQLLAVGEYFRRLEKRDSAKIKSSEQYYDYIKDEFKRSSFEQLHITCLDTQRRVLFSGLIAQGKSNTISVTLAAVLHHPIRLNTPYFYLAHNHPNGTSKPSSEDISFTLKVKAESQKFGLRFDDHLVLGEKGFYSFSLKGLL